MLNQQQEDFIRVNQRMLESLIDAELETLKASSVDLDTPEEREEARLVYLRIKSYKGQIKNIIKPKKKKDDFTGI